VQAVMLLVILWQGPWSSQQQRKQHGLQQRFQARRA
jgi:hypothetical protein